MVVFMHQAVNVTTPHRNRVGIASYPGPFEVVLHNLFALISNLGLQEPEKVPSLPLGNSLCQQF